MSAYINFELVPIIDREMSQNLIFYELVIELFKLKFI